MSWSAIISAFFSTLGTQKQGLPDRVRPHWRLTGPKSVKIYNKVLLLHVGSARTNVQIIYYVHCSTVVAVADLEMSFLCICIFIFPCNYFRHIPFSPPSFFFTQTQSFAETLIICSQQLPPFSTHNTSADKFNSWERVILYRDPVTIQLRIPWNALMYIYFSRI